MPDLTPPKRRIAGSGVVMVASMVVWEVAAADIELWRCSLMAFSYGMFLASLGRVFPMFRFNYGTSTSSTEAQP